MNGDSLPYTVRLEVYRKGRWDLVDGGTEVRAEPSAEDVARAVADSQQLVEKGMIRVQVWHGADADLRLRPQGNVLRDVGEKVEPGPAAMVFIGIFVIVVLYIPYVLAPLVLTFVTVAVVWPAWLEGASVGDALLWSVQASLAKTVASAALSFVLNPRRMIRLLRGRETLPEGPRPVRSRVVDIMVGALWIASVLAFHLDDPLRIATFALAAAVLLSAASWVLNTGGRRLGQRIQRLARQADGTTT